MRATLKRWSGAAKAWGKKAADGARNLWAKAKAVVSRKAPPAVVAVPPHRPASRSIVDATSARTQPMAFGALTSRRYGSFASKTAAPGVVSPRTQPQAWGAMSSRRYGSFAGKTAAPVSTGGLFLPIIRRRRLAQQ